MIELNEKLGIQRSQEVKEKKRKRIESGESVNSGQSRQKKASMAATVSSALLFPTVRLLLIAVNALLCGGAI